MKTHLFLPLLLAAALATAACSDDGAPEDPAGTIALNMLDEENGKTQLASSGIYIDRAQNFVARDDCALFVTGPASGLGSISARQMETPAEQAAVEPGWGYIAARPQSLVEFPSGRLAVHIDAELLKFYVVSALERDGRRVGAAVKYVIEQPETYGLPACGSTPVTIDPSRGEREGVLELPTSDFEYDYHCEEGTVTVEKQGRSLRFRINETGYWGSSLLWLRIHGSCTLVYVEVMPE